MIKIYIDKRIHDMIVAWDEEHADLEKRIAKAPMLVVHNDMSIEFYGGVFAYYRYRPKQNKVKVNIKYDSTQIVKGEFTPTPDGENDYGIYYKFDKRYEDKLKEKWDNVAHIIKMVVSDWIIVNNLFIYGNVVEGGNGDEYFIREYDDNIYLIKGGTHRSPDGIFSVRGHFRKYKNGKIIWIDEYLKGLNK